jgi:hypothetical protein
MIQFCDTDPGAIHEETMQDVAEYGPLSTYLGYVVASLPGVLQTEQFADAVIRSWRPDASTEQINRWVTARQEIGETVFADEVAADLLVTHLVAAGNLQVVGHSVMKAALGHLQERMLNPPPNTNIGFLDPTIPLLEAGYIVRSYAATGPTIRPETHTTLSVLDGDYLITEPRAVERVVSTHTQLSEIALRHEAGAAAIGRIIEQLG